MVRLALLDRLRIAWLALRRGAGRVQIRDWQICYAVEPAVCQTDGCEGLREVSISRTFAKIQIVRDDNLHVCRDCAKRLLI